jgi:nitroreductase
MTLTEQDIAELVAEANLAPSVHNIQPTRFRIAPNGGFTLFEDVSVRLRIGDPHGADAGKSAGAALEGLAIAASARGWRIEAAIEPGEIEGDGLRALVRARIIPGGRPDPLRPAILTRRSHRGPFAQSDASAACAALAAACPDLLLLRADAERRSVAHLFDATSLAVLRDRAYRAELLSWMRLSPRHPRWSRDGLNAEAMALSAFEAAGAGIVLGRGFGVLDAFGLAGPLISEAGKVASAAAIGLFHRPPSEPDIEIGRRFYRVWLQMEALGLAACPMSVLADHAPAAAALVSEYGLSVRKLVTVFRIGPRPEGASVKRARCPVRDLIV